MVFTEENIKNARCIAGLLNRAKFTDLAMIDILLAKEAVAWFNDFLKEMPAHIMELKKITEEPKPNGSRRSKS